MEQVYLVSTENGIRPYYGQSEQHARDQHLEGYAGQAGEEIISITIPLCDHCERKPSTQLITDGYGELNCCNSCAAGIKSAWQD